MLSDLKGFDAWTALALAALLAAAWVFPRSGDRWLTRLAKAVRAFAKRRRLAVLTMMLVVPLLRLGLLPILPVPVPAIHDEFSHLLAGDTFAHGRLTNPTPPMWPYLETIHVNMRPTYMSKYPPAQGFVLGAGELLGNPWIGVLLSISLMCGAALWALQGWLPPGWALLGGVLVASRLALFSYWINSYWGGAVTAIGGALVIGALPRLLRKVRLMDSILLGAGAAILANSRPLEGFVFCLPVAVYLLFWLGNKKSPAWRITAPKLVAPVALWLFATAAFIAYDNWRVTGDPLVLPYMVNDAAYSSTPLFLWQKLRPPVHQSNPQLEDFYNRWSREYWSRMRFAVHLRAAKFIYFYLWPEFCVPFLALPWLLKDRRVRFLVWQFAFCFAGLLVVVWFEPHYAAAMLVPLFALVVQAMRHMRQWRPGGQPRGLALVRAMVIFSLAMNAVYAARAFADPGAESFVAPLGVWSSKGNWERARIEAKLEKLPGQQLVIVRFEPGAEGGAWVYNKADIGHAKVVWARETAAISVQLAEESAPTAAGKPEQDLQPLLDYFKGRKAWLLDLTKNGPRLIPYSNASTQH